MRRTGRAPYRPFHDNHSLRVAIVGGGIGGLTLGLALREHGVDAEIYEAAPELAEIGAAVAQSANATKILRRLGLLDQLTAVATSPTELKCGLSLTATGTVTASLTRDRMSMCRCSTSRPVMCGSPGM